MPSQAGPGGARRRGTRMRLGRMAAVAAGVGGAPGGPRAAPGDPPAPGRVPSGGRGGASPRYREGSFHNPPGPVHPPAPGGRGEVVRELLFGGGLRRPSRPIPVVCEPAGPAAEGLAVTWYGHASTLVEIEGRRVLFDPVWRKRGPPSPSVGPRPLHPVAAPPA